MAKVIGPMPSADGAGPPAGAPPAVQPVRYMSPAARTAIPGIARLMLGLRPGARVHVAFVDACYARPLGICQQHHITSQTCFAGPARCVSPAIGKRGHPRCYPRWRHLSMTLGLTRK